MPTFLFDDIIFGPVNSRRLGSSLGVNLLPKTKKICNFNCLYCECGLTNFSAQAGGKLPTRHEVGQHLQQFLEALIASGKSIDTITFAGNGEPTMHPEFGAIINDTIDLRNKFSPGVKIAVLSNATLIGREDVKVALQKVDCNLLKLDSAIEDTIKKINCPTGQFSLKKLIEELKTFNHNLTIQTLFIRGEYQGRYFDNTSGEELHEWLKVLNEIKPKQVMVYTISRDTPVSNLQKIDIEILSSIAKMVEKIGIPALVSA